MLKADYNIDCSSWEWYAFLPVVLLVLITFTFGLPVFLACFIRKNRDRLYTKTVFDRVGFMYNRFRRGCETW